jgi:ABC-2 type transport system ATP-binding protein
LITARGLVQTFHTKQGREKVDVQAVKGVDLDVAEGEIVSFLGPNGAGKTTTLRMLTTLLKPTAGTATVNGFDVIRDPVQVRRSIGYVSQAGSTSQVARAGEEIMDHGMLYGISAEQAERRGKELFDQLALDGLWQRQPKSMSGGQRRRLDIAMGLVHLPRVLFLDEPSTGLDPQNRINLQELIQRLHAETGSTVVLTTHYLEEADALAGRVIVVDHGRVIADDSAARLKSGLGDLVRLGFGSASDAARAATRLSRVPDSRVDTSAETVDLRVKDGSAMVGEVLADLAADGVPPTRVEVARPTLDDVFLDLTGRSLRETQQTTTPTEIESEVAA